MFNFSSFPLLTYPGTTPSDAQRTTTAAVSDQSSDDVASTRATYSLSERFSRDDSFSLSLTTQDGDQVEITFSSETGYQADYAQSSSAGQQQQRYSIDKGQSSEFGFSVAGELDADEIDAIASLVQELSSLAANFFNGDLQTAMQQVGDLSFDSEHLAQMDLSMQQTIEYRAVEQYRTVQSLTDNVPTASENRLMPFVEQLEGVVSRSEATIESASNVSMNLLATLVQHDVRFSRISSAEQGALKDNLAQLSQWIDKGHRDDYNVKGERQQHSKQGHAYGHTHAADESHRTR
ncbi:hypothetical protein Q4488_01475 [Amphritea sp. 1_MG-2023]|uniref:hypothetical protein n=1 Tax=Amphritea sp. 1_MG-2023 TaxID=3062670 RepID=UPI0026E146C9|nr:hypothetical protein [Amphritea sp. 1_MG-2023]MDO6562038.1 hypothetical protein [Amphritea sp. 1_MG-2023]